MMDLLVPPTTARISLLPLPARRPLRYRNPATRIALMTLLAAVIALGCGRKAPPRPPQFVRPETIGDLTARAIPGGIRLVWTRPTRTVDGRTMPDLDGVKIVRAAPDPALDATDLDFEHIATIHLDDRARFAKVRKMTFDDTTGKPGTVYLYRVIGFTLDGYFGAPSRVVRLRWPGSSER